jgi:hypothetical protein
VILKEMTAAIGCLATIYGFYLAWPPLAFIVGGVSIVLASLGTPKKEQ